MTTTTTTPVSPRGLKYKIHHEFFDFIPGFEKQAAEFKKAIIHDAEGQFNKKGKGKDNKGEMEEPTTWPYNPSTAENAYAAFIEKVVNEKTRTFFPAKDEDNRAVPNTGAYFTVRSIVRVKLADDSEYLLTKGDIHAYDALGEPVNFYVPYREKWTKTIFRYKTDIDPRTKTLEKILEGPSGQEEVYELPFTKENAKELWDQRANDLIQLIVKDERDGGNAVSVCDTGGSPQKSFELFRDLTFEELYRADYIAPALKEEMRMKAVSEGWIRGGTADYTSRQASNNTTGKNVYK
jgi:hypothetical protein